ncbi:prepilin-type N-terminal cleavage/methylation domain-containing protein [Anaeromyxobacter sp. PSR-1]|uniref:prepilin-type N-terminal cleavage/methylation domain-containing protein n=1 Tax=Anaeromyxobacter sp. PSR-1 TaxID=1300915 RepID=UPI0005DE3EA7|nr:prepilin-type N-terminal cleavage/methylation domain-containing protein [Anaeromyxobacter sp. PSR-1]GAO02299.1 hypothetical protein PSR1_01170 [Anaeromyxobacter sp. PSR-1]
MLLTRGMNRNPRGFTLLELVIVVAVVAILAAVAGSRFVAAQRNASSASAAFDLGMRLQALKTEALNEQQDVLAVLVNADDLTGSGCGLLAQASCVRLFILKRPEAGWTLAGFDPASPATAAQVEDVVTLPRWQAFDLGQAGTSSEAPFEQVKVFDPSVAAGGRVAIRFGADGEVRPVYAGASRPRLSGVAVAITTSAELNAGQRRRLVVSFPTGIVKVATY